MYQHEFGSIIMFIDTKEGIHMVTTFKYVEGVPDPEAPEVV